MTDTHRPSEDFYAARVRTAAPSPTLAVSEGARRLRAQGVDVIDLGGGDPDFITPEHIRQAAIDAMNGGDTHYVSPSGTPALRAAIAAKLQRDNGITVDPNGGVLVTPGGKASLFMACLAYIDERVDVLIPEPYWVSYPAMVGLAGGHACGISLDPDANFHITEAALEAAVTQQSRVMIINTPGNPTGRVLRQDELAAIAAVAIRHDLLVFTDEMYEKIVFDGHRHMSIATLPGMAERTLTFNGFSKAYAMTGWRVGYVAGPNDLIRKIATVNSHSATCATSFVQAGAVAAYEGPQESIQVMVAQWDRRRKLVTAGFNSVRGMRVHPIEGAFYAFVDARETGLPTDELAKRILDDAHVAVVPGTAFGGSGEGHFRLSFATSDALLEDAIERVRGVFGER